MLWQTVFPEKNTLVQTERTLNQRVLSGIQNMRYPSYRPVSNTSEQKFTCVCFTIADSSGSCNRCYVSQLKRDMGLRLPSLSFDSSISKEITNGRVSDVLYTSTLGRSSMVSNAHVTSDSSFSMPASGQGPPVSTSVTVSTSHSIPLLFTCLAAMQQRMQSSGISGPVAR